MAVPEGSYVSKVVLGSDVLIDLTGDTVVAEHLKSGVTAHGKDGAPIVGTNTFDVNSTDATAAESEILIGKTAYARGTMLTGSMPNNEGVEGVISTVSQVYNVPLGYHDGSGTVQIDETEQAKIIADNIKNGVEILGVLGTLAPRSDVTAQKKYATPTFSVQNILPDEGTDYLSEVEIAAIPVTETVNGSGGYTVTIGMAS